MEGSTDPAFTSLLTARGEKANGTMANFPTGSSTLKSKMATKMEIIWKPPTKRAEIKMTYRQP